MRKQLEWHDPPTIPAPDEHFCAELSLTPLTAQILQQRGFTSLETARPFLDPAHYRPAPSTELPDLEIAAGHLEAAIRGHRTILVWGDFDVDGQTATALLVDGLRSLGAEVAYYIPHRLRESHGILLDSLRDQLDRVRPGVLLSCDTGVSAHEAIDYAKSRGAITLVTDHHDLPPALPAADAVVNPKRLPHDHALAALPGVGVAYKLIEHLYTRRDRAGELTRLLDLVALGIVADVAEQTRDTRYLLQQGLERLRQTQRIGLRALIDVAGLQPDRLSAIDIGFQLGPRLNAAGRMDDANPVVELLTTSNPVQAGVLARNLEGLNVERRMETRQIYAAAQDQIAQDPTLLDWEALVLAHPSWHAGILGIVAGQLAEQYARPVVLLTMSDDGPARGSARSAPGYDIGAAIAAQADLLLHHGGHPGAAGLALHPDNIPAFRRRLSNTLRDTRDPSVRPVLPIDAYLSLSEITPALVADLNRLAPFGEGNPPITLAARDLRLKSDKTIGRTGEHRRLVVEDEHGTRQTVLWWRGAEHPLPHDPFDLAFQVEISTYKDASELQLTLVDFRRSASAPPEIVLPTRQVDDYRQSPHPDAMLAQTLREHPDAVIWAEGYRRVESPGVPLSDLAPAETLVIYTAPASVSRLLRALERVDPARVVLLAVDPPLSDQGDVQRRLLELIKYVLNQQDGQTTLGALAGALGHTPQTIQHVLDYYAARGEITVSYPAEDDTVLLAPGSGLPDDARAATALSLLKSSLDETRAYRAHFRRADPYHILGWDGQS
jgi:single-stranded-DNA-specific exonuclease